MFGRPLAAQEWDVDCWPNLNGTLANSACMVLFCTPAYASPRRFGCMRTLVSHVLPVSANTQILIKAYVWGKQSFGYPVSIQRCQLGINAVPHIASRYT
jgi:hypothetical protein